MNSKKNNHIHCRMDSLSKARLIKKSEGYESLTDFLETIANNTIIIVTPEVAKMFELMGGKIKEKLQV